MSYIALSQGLSNVLLETTCPFCQEKRTALFKTKELQAWNNGELIQNAMPNTSADDREFLMTGICNKCFPSEE